MTELNSSLCCTFTYVGVAQKPVSYYCYLGILLYYYQKYNPKGWRVINCYSFLSNSSLKCILKLLLYFVDF